MSKAIEIRIRTAAAAKVKVRITAKTRSKGGYFITGPDGLGMTAKTKREALQNLLARVRCWRDTEWRIVELIRLK